MDGLAYNVETSSVGLKIMSLSLLRRDDSRADRSRVAANSQGPEIGNEVCELCGRNAMQSYLQQSPPWQDHCHRISRIVGERLEVRLWKSDFDGMDEPVPGLDGLVDVGSGVRRPALRLSETIETDSGRRIWFMVDEAITTLLPRIYLVHHHGLR